MGILLFKFFFICQIVRSNRAKPIICNSQTANMQTKIFATSKESAEFLCNATEKQRLQHFEVLWLKLSVGQYVRCYCKVSSAEWSWTIFSLWFCSYVCPYVTTWDYWSTKPEYDVLNLSFSCSIKQEKQPHIRHSHTVRFVEGLEDAPELSLGSTLGGQKQQQGKSGSLQKNMGNEAASRDEPELQRWHTVTADMASGFVTAWVAAKLPEGKEPVSAGQHG